ncbi:MAG: hypothetical protein HYV09_01520 [Deltaproteobacteria bacterium]|nr:hypothetical protein [Deltaproteobacteria bacterium]
MAPQLASHPARGELIASCAAIGALGGALFGWLFARPLPTWPYWTWEPVATFGVATAISATLLGWVLSRATTTPREAMMRGALSTMAAGAFNGALLVVYSQLFQTRDPLHFGTLGLLVVATLGGAVFAIPFVPAVVSVAISAARVQARRATIAGGSQRRRVVRAAVTSLALAAMFIPLNRLVPWFALLPVDVAVFALVVTVGLVLLDVNAARVLARATRGPDWVPAPRVPDGAAMLDFGIGDELWVRRVNDETYRAAAKVPLAQRGDAFMARAVVRDTLRGHAVAAALCVASLAVLAARR